MQEPCARIFLWNASTTYVLESFFVCCTAAIPYNDNSPSAAQLWLHQIIVPTCIEYACQGDVNGLKNYNYGCIAKDPQYALINILTLRINIYVKFLDCIRFFYNTREIFWDHMFWNHDVLEKVENIVDRGICPPPHHRHAHILGQVLTPVWEESTPNLSSDTG